MDQSLQVLFVIEVLRGLVQTYGSSETLKRGVVWVELLFCDFLENHNIDGN